MANPSPNSPVEKPLSEYSAEEIRRELRKLSSKEEVYAGVKLLHAVLKSRGVAGVLEYTKLAREVIDKEGKLLKMDFTERRLKHHKESHDKAISGYFNRRDLLATWGCLFSGVAFGSWGALTTADQVVGYIAEEQEKEIEKGPPIKSPIRKSIQSKREFVEHHITGAAELVIGAVLIEECIRHSRHVRTRDYEEITNAAVRFGDLVDEDKKKFAIKPTMLSGRA